MFSSCFQTVFCAHAGVHLSVAVAVRGAIGALVQPGQVAREARPAELAAQVRARQAEAARARRRHAARPQGARALHLALPAARRRVHPAPAERAL